MNAPNKIYVPQHNIEAGNIQELDELIVDGSIEYIRKDTLLEWAKTEIEFSKQVESVSEESYEEGRQQVARLLINYLNSM